MCHTAGHGGVRPSRRWSTCTPRRSETLYVTPRHTQSCSTRSARAWWLCSDLPSSQWAPRGCRPANILGHRLDVRTPTFGDALRDAETHPVMLDRLGARVVAVLGPPSSQWAPRGVSSSGHALAIDPMCAPRRLEVLYVLLRPTQSRPARSARTWWPCWGLPSSQWAPRGGVVQRTCFGHRPDVRAPAFGGALRDAEIHPITPSTLGAHVVAVLGPLVSRWPPIAVTATATSSRLHGW